MPEGVTACCSAFPKVVGLRHPHCRRGCICRVSSPIDHVEICPRQGLGEVSPRDRRLRGRWSLSKRHSVRQRSSRFCRRDAELRTNCESLFPCYSISSCQCQTMIVFDHQGHQVAPYLSEDEAQYLLRKRIKQACFGHPDEYLEVNEKKEWGFISTSGFRPLRSPTSSSARRAHRMALDLGQSFTAQGSIRRLIVGGWGRAMLRHRSVDVTRRQA